jgi:hypothetical protein
VRLFVGGMDIDCDLYRAFTISYVRSMMQSPLHSVLSKVICLPPTVTDLSSNSTLLDPNLYTAKQQLLVAKMMKTELEAKLWVNHLEQ